MILGTDAVLGGRVSKPRASGDDPTLNSATGYYFG